MSKIYEALLRAEQDRAKWDSNQKQENPPEVSQSDLSQTFPADRLDAIDVSLRARNSNSTKVENDARLVPAVETHNLAEVPLQVWRPDLNSLPALQERGSVVEQFRGLRSRMQELREGSPLRSILISSGVPQEGKSFVAMNLAVSLARHNASRVLLIDGDMRRASLYKALGCLNEPGLTEYLIGNATVSEIMQRPKLDEVDAPIPHGLRSLTFIAGGHEADKAADLSGNSRFEELIRSLSPNFEWIVVDSSPVNLVADGVNLARACDGVLLVARGGITKLEVVQRALGELKASKVLGVVLNAVVDPPESTGYYGYEAYVGGSNKEK